MRVQIYTMQTLDEVKAMVALGVDQIGVTPSNLGLPGEVDFATARAIVDAVGESAVSVAISVASDLDAIESMVHAVRPDVLHLCGLDNDLPPAAVGALRKRLPGLPIIQAIPVAGPAAIEVALAYENVAEAIRVVQPWAVDSLTHTNRPLPGGGFCKDLDRVRQFVTAALGEA